ncbi:helicase C-terminal domain-containing protein [Lacticaseibacillus porcinae]|uniref:helicase C-terminal domain-containing protein n=1 Tax=Lacticaseibacillus porcinae TaxID=1123687 RepID=UPI000F785758|nr:helicase C-terminal domain-containing protein [Lacticaseibacillus porcinae]
MAFDQIYAVLDLETTGTAVKNGDRIIQIGCAFVKNFKVIATFSQLINPDRDVPKAIQQLTHIDPEALVAAPYFEMVAEAFAKRLQNCVIVCHNVNFDYPFLSAELERVGLPALTNPAIDTVELAQILLPTLGSYRLQDLTAALGIQHKNPHRADSDAISTAKLLMALAQHFQTLPSVLQHQLVAKSHALIRQTGDFLAQLERFDVPLAKPMIQVGDLVLQALPEVVDPIQPRAYPLAPADKKAILKPAYKWRAAQGKMMDAIYQNATNDQQPIAIEAGTGLGKTMGYLLPYAYLTNAEQKLVVATTTTVLQSQLFAQTQKLADLLDRPINAVIVKSPKHYLDLNQFHHSLQLPAGDRLTAVLQMKLLVWLSQTTTGDLDELHLTTYRAPLFGQVAHAGGKVNGAYADYDFYSRLQQQIKAASIVITNHAYLARHVELSDQSPFLVVDEAQHFADNVALAHAHQLDLAKLRIHLQHLARLINRPEHHNLMQVFADSKMQTYQLQSLATAVATSIATIEAVQIKFSRLLIDPQPGFMAQSLGEADAQAVETQLREWLPRLSRQLDAVAGVCSQLQQVYRNHQDHFGMHAAGLFQALGALRKAFDQDRTQLTALNDFKHLDQQLCRLELSNGRDALSLKLTWQQVSGAKACQVLLDAFKAPVLVGATLMVARKFDYLLEAVGLPLDTQTLRLRSPFHYASQAQVFVDPNAPHPDDPEYLDYLVDALQQLCQGQHQTIVLFNRLDTIKAVYARINDRKWTQDLEILAQGVSGSAEKIAKRFAISKNALLLGAASFFEGVDYPDKQLEMVILTRLPFDAPSQPLVQARNEQLEAQGRDPFKEEALPKATLRLRQSFGRLIRTEHDRGVFICLDPRLVTTKYGKQMQHALPNLKPMSLSVSDMAQYSQAWLAHQPLFSKEAPHA